VPSDIRAAAESWNEAEVVDVVLTTTAVIAAAVGVVAGDGDVVVAL
jgi:hypothetical protein